MSAPADDIHAIQTLKARYCAAADRSAADPIGASRDLAAIFLLNAIGDYGGTPLAGAAAIADYLSTAIAGSSEWLLHMIHTPLIEVAGETATGEWTVMAHLKRRGGGVDIVIGRYADAFRRTPDGWRIECVRFRPLR